MTTQLDNISAKLALIRGNAVNLPDCSIVIPVNAQADLENVIDILDQIAHYTGTFSIEIVLPIAQFCAFCHFRSYVLSGYFANLASALHRQILSIYLRC